MMEAAADSLVIREAAIPDEVEAIHRVFRNEARQVARLGASLDFQGFEAELAGLPGPYVRPSGAKRVGGGQEAAVRNRRAFLLRA